MSIFFQHNKLVPPFQLGSNRSRERERERLHNRKSYFFSKKKYENLGKKNSYSRIILITTIESKFNKDAYSTQTHITRK